MHQKKSAEQVIKIGGESSTSDCFFSDLRPTQPPLFPLHQIHTLGGKGNFSQSSTPQGFAFSLPNKPHLTIQIPPNPPSIPTHSHHETFSDSSAHALLSTPHKRSVMTQTPAKSPALPSFKNHGHHRHKDSSFSQPFSCSGYFAIPFDAQRVADTLIRHLSGARLICFQLRFLFLLSLASIYFLVSNPGRFFVLNFLFLLAFSLTLLISLNLGLPRLPSIRLLLARSLPSKFSSFGGSSSKSSRPVIWSIGAKPKSERKVNSGYWVQVYSNGDVYEGEFHKGKFSGSGVYYYHMKGRYEGDWVDGKYDGHGVETWARGSRYRGQYRQGLRHGIGVYRFYTGDVYAGEWSNGQCHGCGVHTCEDGSRYVGEFKWGVKHGLGHYHFRNGDTYAGEYFADKMHGYGIYQFGNGHKYEGAWHEGRRQGLGMYTRNGETQCGHWQNGSLDLPSSQNTHLGSVYPVSHSKILDAVQEARRAAEKAYELAKIDERVNRVVAAANKAANAARVAAVKAVQKQMHHNNSDNLSAEIV
ncbi:hypothetical protein SLA2020_226760 [Shorea laevis]